MGVTPDKDSRAPPEQYLTIPEMTRHTGEQETDKNILGEIIFEPHHQNIFHHISRHTGCCARERNNKAKIGNNKVCLSLKLGSLEFPSFQSLENVIISSKQQQ